MEKIRGCVRWFLNNIPNAYTTTQEVGLKSLREPHLRFNLLLSGQVVNTPSRFEHIVEKEKVFLSTQKKPYKYGHYIFTLESMLAKTSGI